jgi:ABC-2 type transport system permease protein
MTRLGFCLTKEFLQIWRNPFVLRLLLIAPVIQLVLLGYAATLDVKSIPTVFCDLDHSESSRHLAQIIVASGRFVEVARVDRAADVFPYLDTGTAAAAIVIPADYGRTSRGDGTARVQAYFDGANSNEATQARAYLTSILVNRNIQLTQARAARWSVIERQPPPDQGRTGNAVLVEPRIRVRFNETLESSHFMVPGVIAMILMVLMVTMTAVSLVSEKEAGTLQQILVTPLPAHVFLLGKILPFVAIGLFDIVLVLVTGRLVFGVPIRGSIPFLYFTSLLYIATLLGFGLLVSTVANSQQQALTGSYAIVGPNLLLAGFIFPIESMPAAVQSITYLLPMRYFLEILRGIMLKGVGIETLWSPVAALGAYACASFLLSVWLYKKQHAALVRG